METAPISTVPFQLGDIIKTSYSGYNQLSQFYQFCLNHRNTPIFLDFTNVGWFDGNLCALLLAMCHHLYYTNGNIFTTDAKVIKERFDILYRNGFLQNPDISYDDRESTVPIKAFDCNDKEGFCSYVDNELLQHRGIRGSLTTKLSDRIKEDLLEVFCNTNHHANTTDPFFVGGQFYPKLKTLKFTMVDLGQGFLAKISKATNGSIKTNLEAINWAIQGNSTKRVLEDCPGGLGIKSMYNYCKKNKGVLQIISNNGYWSSDFENTVFEGGRELPSPFFGTTINLFFQQK